MRLLKYKKNKKGKLSMEQIIKLLIWAIFISVLFLGLGYLMYNIWQ